MFDRLKHFLLESRRELSRVNWPTRDETIRLTAVVVAISVGIALFLGAFDALFYTGVRNLVPVSSPIENVSSTASSTDLQNNILTPIDVKADGDVKITTEKPSGNKLPVSTPAQ